MRVWMDSLPSKNSLGVGLGKVRYYRFWKSLYCWNIRPGFRYCCVYVGVMRAEAGICRLANRLKQSCALEQVAQAQTVTGRFADMGRKMTVSFFPHC